jgi:transposase-like protein
MARQRSHSIEFKRQVAQEFIAGQSLYALSKRHDISRQLIRVWVQKYEAGALDEDAQAADLLQEYEAKIAAYGFQDVSTRPRPNCDWPTRSIRVIGASRSSCLAPGAPDE